MLAPWDRLLAAMLAGIVTADLEKTDVAALPGDRFI